MRSQLPTNPRKLKRYLENEAYAKDARFWVGKIHSADRMQHGRPINKQALNQLGRKKQSGSKPKAITDVAVYVVRFTLIADVSLAFLKIGITRSTVLQRFAPDAGRYRIDVVHKIDGFSRKDALALEASLHSLFVHMKFRPPMPLLSGGNSECFSFSEDLEMKMRSLVESWHSSVGRARPS